ncbi:MAG: sigma-54 dependent transcriptional regulator [Calditrichia bacterium]
MEKFKILVVDDETDTLNALRLGLRNQDFEIRTAESQKEAVGQLKATPPPDIVVTDLKLRDGSGLDILKLIQKNYPEISVIIITAHGTVDTAIQAIREGAVDYLQKPFRMAELKRLIQHLIETISLRRENERLRQMLKSSRNSPPLIGITPGFKKIIEFIKQIAPSRSTVLISGETGTGKEVAAENIHYYSPRAEKAFININCGAIPENLLEAELFGYERGAFTGAVKQKKGKVELANGGTLFLDEIGELKPNEQVKLLRMLQNGEFERLGGTETLQVDVRVIAATNVNLEEKVADGSFREDLYYRLNVIKIDMPPLRDRLEDLPYLVQFFIEKYNRVNKKKIQGVDPEVLNLMWRYRWRGNIRELENMVERAVVLCQEIVLKSHHFPLLSEYLADPLKTITIEAGTSFKEVERAVIQQNLLYYGNDKTKTAKALQIGLATLYRKLKEYHLG